MAPLCYDPDSPDELEVALPSSPLITLSNNAYLQPPLTRRGTGPGMIAFLPPSSAYKPNIGKPLDPEPVQKWAEEGFAVVGVTSGEGWSIEEALTKGVDALLSLEELDTRDKFAVYVYDPNAVSEVLLQIQQVNDTRLSCIVAIGNPEKLPSVPTYLHLPPTANHPHIATTISHRFTKSPYFLLPQSAEYVPGEATLAHSRVLEFLRRILGGPVFDIEAIWEEHTYFEFEVRSVAKTMGTMVAEPYVNHVPTMTGGVGRKALSAFYRDHFIFANPADATMIPVSRTVGSDRVVDEFIFKLTHDRVVDWLLPGVPPTGKLLEIPMMGVINIRGDRLYHEHIWWDQATALFQAGILASHIPYPTPEGQKMLRLPVSGAESARMLINEMDGNSNAMLGSDWGIRTLDSVSS
ncbi:NTF2-like protein [Lentinula aff. lateritia]|uniref:NTF2-like protein n=1 Tax=Lentinula aff. lateritia TaxID=2804960 RepID=A0ACC1TXV2_9AGAR|nr:NTF2-like protein [Lentinula aff. lateritia]